MTGLNNVVTECVQQGEGTVEESRREVSFESTKSWWNGKLGSPERRASFFAPTLEMHGIYVLEQQHGNVLPQAFCVVTRFSWGPFCAWEKQPIRGSKENEASKLVPEPFCDRMLDTILATFEHLVVFPEVLGDPDDPSYPGSEQSQSERFSTMLALVLKVHEQEYSKMGYNILEIGVHSIRKVVATYISSGTTAAPSSMPVNLWGGWSMDSVQEDYMLYNKTGINTLTGLWQAYQCCLKSLW
jgi:hypothetical protein